MSFILLFNGCLLAQNNDLCALEHIKKFEGLKCKVYIDAKGKKCIGYGHKLLKSENLKVITKEQADSILLKDYSKAKKEVLKNFPCNTVNEITSLTLTTYNLGSKFHHGKLGYYARHNKQEYPTLLARYVYAGKKKLKGLIKRRKQEISIWLKEEKCSQ